MDLFDTESHSLGGENIFGEFDHTDSEIAEDKDEQEEWDRLPLKERWEDVLKRLSDKEVRWNDVEQDDEENPSTTTRPLEPWEKESLAETDSRDKTCPTVLHMLAAKLDTEGFDTLPQQTRLEIIKYLLQHRKNDSAEDPVLTRAIEYHNLDFIHFILQHCADSLSGLLNATDSKGENCLHYIFKEYFQKAAKYTMRVAKLIKKGKTIKDKDLDIWTTRKILERFVQHATPQCISARDNKDKTPIHYALDYKNCRINIPEYAGIVTQLIEKGDKGLESRDKQASQFKGRGESPYLYFGRTRELFLSELARNASAQSNTAAPVTKHVGKEAIPATQDMKRVIGHHIRGDMEVAYRETKDFATKGKMGMRSMYAPPGYAIPCNRTSAPSGNQGISPAMEKNGLGPSLPPEEISNSSQAGDLVAGKIQTMTHKPLREKQVTQRPGEEHEACKAAAERIRRLVKLHYIRTRPEMEAKELLYGKVALDKNLYFDGTHMKGRSSGEVAELIKMLAEPGGFEDTLSYVCLPALSYTSDTTAGSGLRAKTYSANQRRPRETEWKEEQPMGSISAVAVFDELAHAGVRNILQLVVEDMKSPPHTDGAIERAIGGKDSMNPKSRRQEDGFYVEVWDWRKFDLDIDVIRFSTPKVFQVNLYWSGNQTILKGWACAEGIPRLYQESGKILKKVVVHWSFGVEGPQRCESLLADFKKTVEKRTSQESAGVLVQIKKLTMGKAAGGADDDNKLGPSTPGIPRGPPDHSWIETMERFRDALMTVHAALPNDIKPERIKVALIDDGIDRTNLLAYNNRVKVTGMSYWTNSAGMTARNPSWHQSTHGHGTIMASSIIRVNPWVFLYVMRIQDEVDTISTKDGGIRIHAESAARAIEDAITAGVRIISISWTISDIAKADIEKYPEHEVKAVEALKEAIGKAKEAKILIFCSASDDIKKKGIDTLPYSHASNYVFRIGAADAYGWSDKQTEDQHTIDWFFPGNQVADDYNPRAVRLSELEYRDGSSVATALAAGLASLIMYLMNVMKEYYRADARNANKYSNYAKRFTDRQAMKVAFENISNMDPYYKDKKFLPVWDLFGKRAEKIQGDNRNPEANWEVLDELCTKLVV